MEIRGIREEEYRYIVQWNKRKDADFLQQWAGPVVYEYPITVNQIANRVAEGNEIYVAVEQNQILGTFECIVDAKNHQGFLCRVLMDENRRGKGLGTKALQLLVEKVFSENPEMTQIELHVYCYNIGAIRCYEKVGFCITEQKESPNHKWDSYTMILKK